MDEAAAGVMTLAGVLADRSAWAAEQCPIRNALDVVGTRSTVLLMREAYYGTTRFDDFARRVGITDAVASARLRELVEAGLLVRRPYREPGQRTRYEYVLTSAGSDLLPVLLALWQWGDKYLAGEEGPALVLRHTDCSAPLTVQVRCTDGHEVPVDEITVMTARQESQAAGSADR
jgi:DNA-binding HxlR family transcriptional regulator